MSTETVAVQEQVDNVEVNEEVVVDAVEQVSSRDEVVQEEVKEQTVPLSALQKERRKRQEAEIEARLYREQQQAYMNNQKQEEPDDSQYEPVTKADLDKDLSKRDLALIRKIDENRWLRDNPEKAEVINRDLANFLKQRPNLVHAIDAASNRYEEAWELLDKLSPRQKVALKTNTTVRKEAPGSPSGIPKSASINQTVDFSNMSDKEFNEWRASKRKR